ncbi:MAG: hypothetical protein JW888_11715 [Pirellulales bacterium]|nr:hypothetical protein [Pirellulales bacterium]
MSRRPRPPAQQPRAESPLQPVASTTGRQKLALAVITVLLAIWAVFLVIMALKF